MSPPGTASTWKCRGDKEEPAGRGAPVRPGKGRRPPASWPRERGRLRTGSSRSRGATEFRSAEDRELVQVLASLDLYQEIPPDLYKAVAEILVFLYSLNQGASRRLRNETHRRRLRERSDGAGTRCSNTVPARRSRPTGSPSARVCHSMSLSTKGTFSASCTTRGGSSVRRRGPRSAELALTEAYVDAKDAPGLERYLQRTSCEKPADPGDPEVCQEYFEHKRRYYQVDRTFLLPGSRVEFGIYLLGRLAADPPRGVHGRGTWHHPREASPPPRATSSSGTRTSRTTSDTWMSCSTEVRKSSPPRRSERRSVPSPSRRNRKPSSRT